VREVNIAKEKLRERVQANRDNHRSVYESAMDGYRHAAIAWFDAEMDRAVNGAGFDTYFQMPRPEDHTEDYDRVLDMIEMSEDETIKLTSQEFAQYVRDDWGWKREFTATISNYLDA
jgi:DNA-binding FadR family transcriptional regulator